MLEGRRLIDAIQFLLPNIRIEIGWSLLEFGSASCRIHGMDDRRFDHE